jgi:hypothetical protein
VKIIWISHPSNSRKNGTSEHVDRVFGAVAVGYGQAEEVKPQSFVETMKLREEERAAILAKNPSPNALPFYETPKWGLVETPNSPYKWAVIREFHSEKVWYAPPPDNCPKHVADEWRRRTSVNPDFEADKRLQERYQAEANSKPVNEADLVRATYGRR